MPNPHILIIGAGISGSILAHFLAQHPYTITVIERSPASQHAGQGLEIEEPALSVIKAMGVLDTLKERRTGELGFRLENAKGANCGLLEIGGLSPTGSLELMRGDLCEVLYKKADEKENVTFLFQTVLKGCETKGEKVCVELEDRKDGSVRREEFDFVVGADGQRSRTRELLMGRPEVLGCYKPVGAYVAYFSIPKEERDWPYSKLCHFPGRRIVWLRPTAKDSKTTSAYLIYAHDDVPSLSKANAAGDRRKQKEVIAEIYAGLDWETPRVIEQMMEAENFYSEELMQVKLPTWSKDRVVLLGDAAWAPTPFTGQGNQLAIIGAWVLAQELSRSQSQLAFEKYEKRLRKYVEDSQKIPLGGYAPFLFNPETAWGIWVFRTGFWLVSSIVNSGWLSFLGKMLPEEKPEYEFDLEMEKEEVVEEKEKGRR